MSSIVAANGSDGVHLLHQLTAELDRLFHLPLKAPETVGCRSDLGTVFCR